MLGAAAVVTLLTQEGFDTRFANGALDAVDQTRRWIPEIILVDIDMPGYDGFQTARILRRLNTTCHAAIIAYTAQREHDIRDRGVSAGFDAYCQKGASFKTIIWLIQRFARP